MKKNSALLACLLISTPIFSVLAESKALTGCEAKRHDIEQQLNYARSHGNNHRVVGLKKALSEFNANCTDDGLFASRQAEAREKELKVEKRKQDLAEAQSDGRADKISKKQRKLSEARDELAEAKSMLNK